MRTQRNEDAPGEHHICKEDQKKTSKGQLDRKKQLGKETHQRGKQFLISNSLGSDRGIARPELLSASWSNSSSTARRCPDREADRGVLREKSG